MASVTFSHKNKEVIRRIVEIIEEDSISEHNTINIKMDAIRR
jgi:hypothetical protein